MLNHGSCFLHFQAATEIRKGLALDYPATAAEQEQFQLERPLDRYLQPLDRAFELKTSLTEEPKDAEEEVVLLIERGQDAKSPAVRKPYLVK